MAGKKYKAAMATLDRDKFYPIEEAVKLIKAGAKSKFDETIEIAMNLGIDPRHSDQTSAAWSACRTAPARRCAWPWFAKGEKAEAARKAGADIVGADDLAEKVQAGEMNFDRVIATPDMMVTVGKLGKVLGPAA